MEEHFLDMNNEILFRSHHMTSLTPPILYKQKICLHLINWHIHTKILIQRTNFIYRQRNATPHNQLSH